MINRNAAITALLVCLSAVLLIAPDAQAQNQTSGKKKPKHVQLSFSAPQKKALPKKQPNRAPASTSQTERKPTALAAGVPSGDPNKALEIRGQSRTLSMMLVLKNGKENINFIKVRKDYRPEISSTQF
jgi:hypothetical protein